MSHICIPISAEHRLVYVLNNFSKTVATPVYVVINLFFNSRAPALAMLCLWILWPLSEQVCHTIMSGNIMTSIWTGLPYRYVWEYYDLYLNRFAIPLCMVIHIMTAIWTGLPCCYVWEYYYLYLNRFAILLCLGILWPLSKQQCHTFLIFSNWRCQVVSSPPKC